MLKDELEALLLKHFGSMYVYKEDRDREMRRATNGLLALIDAQRCVWTHEEIWYPCLYYTSCGKFMREEFTDDKPFCPFCGHRIEVKEGKDG